MITGGWMGPKNDLGKAMKSKMCEIPDSRNPASLSTAQNFFQHLYEYQN
jgi:hypothetical protein